MRPGYYSEDLIIFFEYTDPSIFAMQFGQWEPLGLVSRVATCLVKMRHVASTCCHFLELFVPGDIRWRELLHLIWGSFLPASFSLADWLL